MVKRLAVIIAFLLGLNIMLCVCVLVNWAVAQAARMRLRATEKLLDDAQRYALEAIGSAAYWRELHLDRLGKEFVTEIEDELLDD